MNKAELRKWLLENAFTKTGKQLKTSRSIPKDVKKDLLRSTDFFRYGTQWSIRIRAVLNGQTSLYRCIVCDKEIHPRRKASHMDTQLFCSKKCRDKSPDRIEKIKRTCLERYGGPSPMSDIDVRHQAQETLKKNYGVTNAMESEEIRERLKRTFNYRYGSHPLSTDTVRNKAKKTILDRYGVTNAMKSEEIKLKLRRTFYKKYGVNSPFESNEIVDKKNKTFNSIYNGHPWANLDVQDKIKKTILDRYGVDNVMMSKVIRSRYIDTCLDRYGVDNAMKVDYIRDKVKGKLFGDNIESLVILEDKDILLSLYKDHSVYSLADILNVCYTTVFKYLRLHGVEFNDIGSAEEQHLRTYISNITKVLSNSRKIIPPYELDIYLPEYDLAIEIDGVYWHSELQGKDKDYHLNKTLLCASKNIQLLHIFSSDNLFIWKCFIENLLGQSQTLYARNTIINLISSTEAKEFCEKNHLQGGIGSKYNYGLSYEGVLVSVMTFSKARFSKADYELLRFCTLRGYRVIGGAGKLLKRFKREHHGSIISYANMRWSYGKLYDALGFKLLHMSKPNYFYTKDYSKLYSRNKFQKHKLSKLLSLFDPDSTEIENMKLNGYDRIWDCGNLVYLLEK